ncbi:hypothetical protein BJX66DRAFT_335267 [Aspergillus keveii]|uniref:Alcohol dehydrogenase-like C-terminal domain-containing protein n=1 Tax=Aspergillus keveii TaxID=714993 RepID=A0ABR4GDH8_9EURO
MLSLSYLDIAFQVVDLENERSAQPKGDQPAILIYSGGSNVGLFAIRLAKKAGYTVVAMASPRSFDLVMRYGPDAVYDYESSASIDKIQNTYPDITKSRQLFQGPFDGLLC